MLSRTSGIHDISLTTNGVLLPKFADELRRGGAQTGQHQSRQPRPGALRAHHARRTSGGHARRPRRRLRRRVHAGQDQHAASARHRGRTRLVRRAHAGARRARAVHRVHAARPAGRRRDDLGGRGTPAAGRRPAAPPHGGPRAHRPRRPLRPRTRPLLEGARTRAAPSASSPASPSTSARPATGCASPPTAGCARASSPETSWRCGRCSVDPADPPRGHRDRRGRQELRPLQRAARPTSRHVPDRRVTG